MIVFNTYKIKFSYFVPDKARKYYDEDIIEAFSQNEAAQICRNRYPGCTVERIWVERPATWHEVKIQN